MERWTSREPPRRPTLRPPNSAFELKQHLLETALLLRWPRVARPNRCIILWVLGDRMKRRNHEDGDGWLLWRRAYPFQWYVVTCGGRRCARCTARQQTTARGVSPPSSAMLRRQALAMCLLLMNERRLLATQSAP